MWPGEISIICMCGIAWGSYMNGSMCDVAWSNLYMYVWHGLGGIYMNGSMWDVAWGNLYEWNDVRCGSGNLYEWEHVRCDSGESI